MDEPKYIVSDGRVDTEHNLLTMTINGTEVTMKLSDFLVKEEIDEE